MSYTESRARYAETLDAVVNDREEVVITRAGREPGVIVALSEYESLRESAYLFRSPANARRLLDSIERLEAGGGVEHASASQNYSNMGFRVTGHAGSPDEHRLVYKSSMTRSASLNAATTTIGKRAFTSSLLAPTSADQPAPSL
jgi:antitoxin YefM